MKAHRMRCPHDRSAELIQYAGLDGFVIARTDIRKERSIVPPIRIDEIATHSGIAPANGIAPPLVSAIKAAASTATLPAGAALPAISAAAAACAC